MTQTTDVDRAYDLDRAHVFHSWSAQGALDPMVVSRAEGSHVWDDGGNRYLDFTSQLVFTNLGHQHPAIIAAIREQGRDRMPSLAPRALVGLGTFADAVRYRRG